MKRLNVADAAFAFALDPMTLGAGLNNSATYTNLRDSWENHRDFGLAPYQAAVEDALTALLPGTQGIKADLDGFANPDLTTRANGYKVAIDSGWMLPEEVRVIEGLPPLDQPPAAAGAGTPDAGTGSGAGTGPDPGPGTPVQPVVEAMSDGQGSRRPARSGLGQRHRGPRRGPQPVHAQPDHQGRPAGSDRPRRDRPGPGQVHTDTTPFLAAVVEVVDAAQGQGRDPLARRTYARSSTATPLVRASGISRSALPVTALPTRPTIIAGTFVATMDVTR